MTILIKPDRPRSIQLTSDSELLRIARNIEPRRELYCEIRRWMLSIRTQIVRDDSKVLIIDVVRLADVVRDDVGLIEVDVQRDVGAKIELLIFLNRREVDVNLQVLVAGVTAPKIVHGMDVGAQLGHSIGDHGRLVINAAAVECPNNHHTREYHDSGTPAE